jgi:hypothetical protein
MKKIGILTFIHVDNPGAVLQAYSTQQQLIERFPDARVEIVNFDYFRKSFFPESRTSLYVSQFIREFRRYLIYRQFRDEFFKLSKDGMVTHDSEEAWAFIEKQHYDLIVVGSDIILQAFPFHLRDGSVPVFWLPSRLTCQKVTLSASAMSLRYNQLNLHQQSAFKDSINGFDLISVRDEVTYELIRDSGYQDMSRVRMIPDPTFMFEIDYRYSEKLLSTRGIDISKPTVLLHLDRTFGPAKKLVSYYRAAGYQILSLKRLNGSDANLTDISPFEWAGLFKHCQLVITHRFHDTLFSLKSFTPVITVVSRQSLKTNDGKSKYHSLLKMFDLHQTNYVDAVGANSIDEVVAKADETMCNFDRHAVKQKMMFLRQQLQSYIEEIGRVLKGEG